MDRSRGSGVSCFISDIDYDGVSKWKEKKKKKSHTIPTIQPLLTQAYILFHAKVVTNITSTKPNAI